MNKYKCCRCDWLHGGPAPLAHHAAEGLAAGWLVRLLQHTLQQQGVLGQPLVWLHYHVSQLQSVTLLVRLSPL